MFSERSVVFNLEDSGKVGVVTLNKPGRLNAMTVSMGQDFETIMKEMPSTVKAVVITAEGRAFSAGGDLRFLEERANDTPINNAEEMMLFYKRYLSMRDLGVPLISAINGPAVGAGLGLAMATDIRISYNGCSFSFNYSRVGLHPGLATTLFTPMLIGYENAYRMLLTGDTINGTEAKKLGLISQCVEKKEQVLPEAIELASRIVAQPEAGVVTMLQTLRESQKVAHRNIEAVLRREADAQAQCYAAPELAEAVADAKAKLSAKGRVFRPTFSSRRH